MLQHFVIMFSVVYNTNPVFKSILTSVFSTAVVIASQGRVNEPIYGLVGGLFYLCWTCRPLS